MNEFSKTEALKRLRTIAAQARVAVGGSSAWRIEVGHRTQNVVLDTVTRDSELMHEHDDLNDFDDLPDAAKREHVRTHGAVVHLYLSKPEGFGAWRDFWLEDVVIGWMGTSDEPARLVNVNGRNIETRVGGGSDDDVMHECAACGTPTTVMGDDGEFYCAEHMSMSGVTADGDPIRECYWCGDVGATQLCTDGEFYCAEHLHVGGGTAPESCDDDRVYDGAEMPAYNARLALRAIREYVEEAQHGEDFPNDSLDALLDDIRAWVDAYPAFARVELSMHRYDDGTGIAVDGIDYDGDEFAHEFCDAEFALMFDTLHRSNGFSYDEIAAAIPGDIN